MPAKPSSAAAISALPVLAVQVDGRPAAADWARGLMSVRVDQALNLPSACELCWACESVDALLPEWVPGAALTLHERGAAVSLFEGRVTTRSERHSADGQVYLVVSAHDALFDLRERQTVRLHAPCDVASLAETLVSDLGLQVQADHRGPEGRALAQTGSDLQLLQRQAGAAGLYATLRGQCLHLLTLDGLDDGPVLSWADGLLDLQVDQSRLGGAGSCRVAAWDPPLASALAGHADAEPVRGAPSSGPSDPPPAWCIVDQRCATADQADGMARAERDVRCSQRLIMSGTARGDASLRPGARLRLQGIGGGRNGTFGLTACQHSIDATRGFVTRFDTTPPPAPSAHARGTAAGMSMSVGEVTAVDDPQSLARVRVSLPAFDGIETDWIQVLSCAAGQNKGLIALPDTGDRVLVLLDPVDPSQAVVLGGLYGPQTLPEGERVRGRDAAFSLLTPSGLRVRLDEGRRTLRLDQPDGSYVELSPDAVTLHAQSDLTLEAPGRRMVLRASQIDFERA